MRQLSRFVIAVMVACAPLLAGAEGKCNDDPFETPNGLAVTWTIPLVDATVDDNPTDTLLADLDYLFGDVPRGFSNDYPGTPAQYPFPPQNRQSFTDSDAVAGWLGGLGIPVGQPFRNALDQYFALQTCVPQPGGGSTCSVSGLDCDPTNPCKKVVVYGWQVRHPPAPNKGKGFKFCTCMLQRAALVFYGDDPDPAKKDTEELWVRTRFRSARPASPGAPAAAAHFTPTTPVVFTFESRRIWFPLAFNKLPSEPGRPAWLLLDILTRTPLPLGKVPPGFQKQQMSRTIDYAGVPWSVMRIWRRHVPGNPASDLVIVP